MNSLPKGRAEGGKSKSGIDPLWIAGACLTLLGLVLRIAGAQGDLWLDEIHSLNLVESLHRPDEVFWNINHDNNHFLTSLYFFLIGGDHPSWILRLPSILAGTLSIPVAGLVAYAGSARDRVAALAATVLMAISYPSVHFGSEARGYIGLVLCTFLAILVIESKLPDRAKALWLGVVLFIGVLSHMLMVFVMAGLMLWRMALIWKPRTDPFDTLFRVVREFWAGIALMGVVGLCVEIGSLHHSFIRGGSLPSTHRQTLAALDGFYAYASGLPHTDSFVVLWVVMAVLTVFTVIGVRQRRPRCLLYAIMMVLYPSWLLFSGALEIAQPRYSMPLLAPFVLLVADCVSIGVRSGRAARWATIVVFGAMLIGCQYDLCRFYAEGRGHYREAVALMTANGPATYGSNVVYGHARIVDYYAGQLNVSATFLPVKDWCVIAPDWLIYTASTHPAEAEEHFGIDGHLYYGPPRCQIEFSKITTYEKWGLSGWAWTLYKRVEIPASAGP